MSSRLAGKDKTYIMGLFKNASQAIKQIKYNNKGWEVIEDKFFRSLDKNDPEIKVYIPVRDEWERHESTVLETISDILQSRYIKITEDVLIPEIIDTIIKDLQSNSFSPLSFQKHPDHFSNDIGELFLKEVFGNGNWKGMQIYYFDINYMSSHLPQHTGIDFIIPKYHFRTDTMVKPYILERLKAQKNYHMNPGDLLLSRVDNINCREFIWKQIKQSKHWINFK